MRALRYPAPGDRLEWQAMANSIYHDQLDRALRRCGSSWNAGQVHGLLCSRLSVHGAPAGADWLQLVLENADTSDALARECAEMLETLFADTRQRLLERQSEFAPLLPEDADSTRARAEALAQWCEGFLHGLVSDVRSERLKERLAEEPLRDIIRDMLEITRATVEDDSDDASNEEAYVELVEYLRVAAQLTYEELAEFRVSGSGDAEIAEKAPVLH